MKTGRRQDPEGLRRIPREREAALGRVRKRPSMLLEFQGKHFNHRDPNRERSHYRYYQQEVGSGVKGARRERYGPVFFKNETMDSRSFSSSYDHVPSHHPSTHPLHEESVAMVMNNSHDEDEDTPTKRPRFLGDVQLDMPRSAFSLGSGSVPLVGSAMREQPSSHQLPSSSPSQGLGLRAYLEDINSDEEEEADLLTVDEEDKPPEPTLPNPPAVASSGRLTKEQLLQEMESVDREIAATEEQIAALLKKKAELEGSGPSSSPLHQSLVEGEATEGGSAVERRSSPKRSLLEMVYSENKLKARTAHSSLHHLSPSFSQTSSPLYAQPWEAPGYSDIIARHQNFRPQLVQLILKVKREAHQKEVELCQQYDAYQELWMKRLDKIENSSKRKARDLKNRELFERTFPELKLRREQQERLMRVDQRGYGVVRSELELSQLMCELFEQEEAPARNRRTHALIPAMVVGGPEERLAFHSTNGLIQDPMSLYRASKTTNVWSEEEKAMFREKYALYPKNFEMISSYLAGKTTAECVRYYYQSKKKEKFKQVVRKATSFKRRKFIKHGDMPGLVPHTPSRLTVDPKIRSPLLSEVTMAPRTPPTTTTPTLGTPTTPRQEEMAKEEPLTPKTPSRYGDWTEEDISNLRAGLRKWGRAWGKIYRELGGRKTATHCKKFFDDFSHDQTLGLTMALRERSSAQNAEKAQRKVVGRKAAAGPSPLARKRVGKTKTQQQRAMAGQQAESEGERLRGEGREGESEAMESVSTAETGSAEEEEEESGSESTLTDSSPEESAGVSAHSSIPRSWKRLGSSASPSHSSQQGSDKGAFDLFISAAEALNDIVPPEVALHDHNYSLAPLSSVDLQGTSGLSLIAAAAAVVSPSLSRSAGSGKLPAVSPVRAPRGRPPNTQRRGSSGSSCKLSPTFLSPAGSSIYVPLTDTTKTPFRSRARSAPSDRPRLQLSRAGPSNLRYSISSKSAAPRPILPPASYARSKDAPGAALVGAAPSLKSMIASRPQQTTGASNAAFETLVNVAVAASPAELPKSTPNQPTATLSISFQNPSPGSTPTTPPTSGPALTEATYSLDMSQAMINILSLAQLTTSSSSSSTAAGKTAQQLLLAPGVGSQAPGLLGTLVSHSSSDGRQATPSAAGKSPNPNTVNVLIGHLTSGTLSPGAHSESSSGGSRGSSAAPAETRPTQKPTHKPPQAPASAAPASTSTASSSGDLSNLNLLSSLVAVVAGSQATPPHTHHTSSSSPSSRSSSLTYSVAHSTQPCSTPSTLSSVSTPRSSAFKATNLPTALPTAASIGKPKESCSRTKPHEKPSPSLSSLVNSDHAPRSSSLRGSSSGSSPLDNLARSVVRSSSLTHPQSSLSTANSSHPVLPVFPSPSPSISQQSTLLLYTRSLSLPSSTSVSAGQEEEEDHLESATRGISELSKLLGTDTEPLGSSSDSSSSSSYRNSWTDQPLPPLPLRTARSGRGAGLPNKTELGSDSGKFLSGLLESHSSHTHHSPRMNSTSTDIVNSSHNLPSR